MSKPKQERTEFNKPHKCLRRNVGSAIADFNMIEAGDVVVVCLSGGKDSYTLLDIILYLQKTAPIQFDILETFFLNIFYAGKLKAMPPK